jgi:hypothetical protein
MSKKIKVLIWSNEKEIDKREDFIKYFKESPIPDDELLTNLWIYMNRQSLSRLLFMSEIYTKIINTHWIIIEFWVRRGQNLCLFSSLRWIYEPFNYNRKIVGFDTFWWFPEIAKQDGEKIAIGNYSVSDNYDEYLEKILEYHETESPISHIKKYELIKGDATKTFEEYLDKNPHTIVALAYFDFDIYIPTKVCLEKLMKRITKWSIIVFDELNCAEFPGETLAVIETIGLSRYAIKRSPLNPLISYIIID